MRIVRVMNELDELRQEVLENTDLDINEKMCLIVLLCGSGAGGEREIARLMGVTVQTARLALDSLKKKGYLSSQKPYESDAHRTVSSESKYQENRLALSDEATANHRRKVRRDEWEDDEDPRDAESQWLASYLMSDERRVEGSGLIKKGSTRASIAQQRYANSTSQRSNKEKEALEQLEKARESFSNRNVPNRQLDENILSERQFPEDDGFLTFQRNALSNAFVEKTVSTKNSAFQPMERPAEARLEQDPKRRPTTKVREKGGNLSSSAMREITEEKVLKVMQLMDEALTRPEATIILGFAGGDYEKVERVYERIRRTQIKDKVDALVKLLQSEE